MKKLLPLLLLFIFSIFFLNQSYSQGLFYNWAKDLSGIEENDGISIKTDNSGNIYVSGTFSGTVDFDPSNSIYNLTSVGPIDIYFAKYNSSGNLIWVKAMGGAYADIPNSITLDPYNNLYITGTFMDTVDFDPSGNTHFLNAQTGSMFLAKYDEFGNLIWANNIGGVFGSPIPAALVFQSGLLYLSGFYGGGNDFDPSPATASLNCNGYYDIFIASYDSLGNYSWAKGFGGREDDRSFDLAISNNNNIYNR